MYCHKFYVRTVKVKLCNMTPDFRLPLPRFSAPASSLPKSLLSGGCGGRVCANLSYLGFSENIHIDLFTMAPLCRIGEEGATVENQAYSNFT